MKNKLNYLGAAIVGIAMLTAGAALPVFAATSIGLGVNASATVNVGVGSNVSARVAALVKTAQSHADEEIMRRINALNALSARVDAMVKLSAIEKASLSTSIQSQITALTNLQSQIAADAAANSTSSLKADIQSITKSYRIYALIIPQGALDAAADRVLNIAGMFTTLAGQFQADITAAQNAGSNMSASVSALADMNAKVADANTQTNAAISEIASLKPDNGDATVKASNTAALKSAHTKIQAAQQDLVAARKDAGTILKALLAIKVSGSATVSTTASTSVQ